MKREAARAAVALSVVVCLGKGLALARDLSFEDRVKAQKAIEQVYWNHRTWPKENPGPKPPLAAVISDEDIRRKVTGAAEEASCATDYPKNRRQDYVRGTRNSDSSNLSATAPILYSTEGIPALPRDHQGS